MRYGRYATPIGILHPGRRLELAFSAIEYWPEVERMLRRLGIECDLSDSGMREALRLVNHN